MYKILKNANEFNDKRSALRFILDLIAPTTIGDSYFNLKKKYADSWFLFKNECKFDKAFKNFPEFITPEYILIKASMPKFELKMEIACRDFNECMTYMLNIYSSGVAKKSFIRQNSRIYVFDESKDLLDEGDVVAYLRLHSRFGDFQMSSFNEMDDLPEVILQDNMEYINELIAEDKKYKFLTLLDGEVEAHKDQIEAMRWAAEQIFGQEVKLVTAN